MWEQDSASPALQQTIGRKYRSLSFCDYPDRNQRVAHTL